MKFAIFTLLNFYMVTYNCRYTDEFDPNRLLPINKRRPEIFDEKEYCETCLTLVKTILDELSGKKDEADIIEIISNIYDPNKYYQYIPIELKRYAEHFISVFEEELILSLKERKNDYHAINSACYQHSLVLN